MKKLLLLFVVVLIFRCGASSKRPDWSKYEPGLKERIDNSNCSQLQYELYNADENSDTRLISYIDDIQKAKKCI